MTLQTDVIEFLKVNKIKVKKVDSRNQKFLNEISLHQIPDGFIKVTESPLGALSDQQKVLLNRKGNELFNNGHIDEATRIFITTGYSDGLTRVGDVFFKKNETLKALKFYSLAKNKNRCQPIIEKIAATLSFLSGEN